MYCQNIALLNTLKCWQYIIFQICKRRYCKESSLMLHKESAHRAGPRKKIIVSTYIYNKLLYPALHGIFLFDKHINLTYLTYRTYLTYLTNLTYLTYLANLTYLTYLTYQTTGTGSFFLITFFRNYQYILLNLSPNLRYAYIKLKKK
jgi:hypothetical protein